MILIQIYFICKSFFESFEMLNTSTWEKRRKIIWIFAKYLVTRVQDAMILNSASALSYTTLLAVVPFMAIILSVFTFFPIFADIRQQVQELILQYLMPDTISNVQNYMNQFIGAAGKLTTFGAIGIAVTAVLMLSTIESSFNFIFQVRSRRKLTTQALSYAFIIVVCPLLLGSALYLKGYILTLKYFNPEHLIGYNLLFTILLPHLLTFGFLMLCYVVIPNKKIRRRNALWGAVMAVILMQILRTGFGYFIELNVTYRTIYGALAAIPVLLVWMYLWWTVVLSGAIFTASLEEFRYKKKIWRNKKQSAENQRKKS